MQEQSSASNRRTFLKSAVIAAMGSTVVRFAKAQPDSTTHLFDGKTLDGWIQAQNSASAFSGNDIADLAGFAKLLNGKSGAVSVFLNDQLGGRVKADLAAYAPASTDGKAERSALARNLTRIISGPSLFTAARFQNVPLRPETEELLQHDPHGRDLVRLNRMLLEDAFPQDLSKSPSSGWTVKDDSMASTGAGRGVIYTANDYNRYRLIFTMRHVSGDPDHQACVLIFCTRPQPNEVPLDALAGIQFQVPLGGHWDYRPSHNNAGEEYFNRIVKPQYDPHEWSRVEILADASTGTARMAVAQPIGSKAVEVLDFKDPDAGKTGPIAWQMHNAGLFDEYKNVVIEVNPKNNTLMTVK
jgi:3-keto-disaccharide hydrolase